MAADTSASAINDWRRQVSKLCGNIIAVAAVCGINNAKQPIVA